MTAVVGFAPRWASAPGETMLDALSERSLSLEVFAASLRLDTKAIQSLLSGDTVIDAGLASLLAEVLGGSTAFWLAREEQYRRDLELREADRWVQSLPLKQMEARGWIELPQHWLARVEACLAYFDVDSLDNWNAHYLTRFHGARFRKSSIAHMSEPSLAAWLRQGEREVSRGPDRAWDSDLFKAKLSEAKQLTLVKDPRDFIPQLLHICGEAGVEVRVIPVPQNCPVSGAARFVDGRPLIQLSGRFLSDDHFWFTFFHEAAHVLLHDPDVTYVDALEKTDATRGVWEEEANAFAQDLLLPKSPSSTRSSTDKITARDIIRTAADAGVSPGIVVGQYQYLGILKYSEMNHLKRRYQWNGATLEMK